MPVEHRAESVAFHLEELSRFAAGVLVEWAPSGDPYLHEVADLGETMGEARSLVSLLRDARVEALPRTADSGKEPVDTLFVRCRPTEIDPALLLRAAESRLSPGGRLLISLAGGEGADARIADVEARIENTPSLHIRTVRRSGGDAVIVARRRGRRLRIGLLPDSPGACLQIRTLGPLEELESRGLIELCVLPRDADECTLADRDLLILQRFGGLAAAKMMLAAKRAGVPVALELDDDFFKLPWYNPGAKDYGRREVRLTLTALLCGADSVVTSTPYLKKRMQQYNDRVACMHNIVDTGLFVRRESPFTEPGVTTFGYIGTRTHEEDFRPLLEPLKRLILEGAEKVRAVFIGHVPALLQRLPDVRYLGWFATYQNAANALARSGVDVALAPLMDVEFNRSKSAMKYLEYGACGIPGIFSDVEAYRSFIRNGENGLLVPRHTPQAWDEAMRRVVEEPGERKAMGYAAYRDVVESHSIERRADEFHGLYLEIAERGRRPAPPVVVADALTPTEAPRDSLSLVFNLYEDLGSDLVAMAKLADGIDKDARVAVISGNRDLSEFLPYSGEVRVIPLHDPCDASRLNGVTEALREAETDWVLYVDQRCRVPNDLLRSLTVHLAPGVAAVGPRTTDPASEQSALRILDASAVSNIYESLRGVAADLPSTPARWLDPHCVLLRREAVEAAGGIDESLTWEDALTDLCLRLNDAGQRVLIANNTYVEFKPDAVPPIPAPWRRRSRERLGLVLSRRSSRPEGGELEDPSRIFGTAGESLDVWIWSRPQSRYLMECADRLQRYGDLPSRLHVLHDRADDAGVRAAEALGGESRSVDPSAGSSILNEILREPGSTHALLLHDGVMLAPGAVRAMLNVVLGNDRPVVAPFSNDGSPEQRMLIDRGLSLEDLDELMSERMSARGDRQCRISRCAGFCLMLDLSRARDLLEDSTRPSLGRLTGRLAPGRILQATRAYAHVLSHPVPCPDPDMGAWPGGPFDLSLPTEEQVAAQAELLADLGTFIGRIKPLLAALKENPGDARVLARIGVLYLGQGDIHNAMSFLGRAGKLDPFSPEVKSADRRARRALDGAACAG